MTLGATSQAEPLSATNDEILEILAERIDEQKQSVGIVVGIIDANGQRVVAHGRLAKDDPRPVDGDTVFEIGSVTKVFTALLLADMVERGAIRLDASVSQLLPQSVVMKRAADGRPITLEHLATHMSGLPRLPENLVPADDSDPMPTIVLRSSTPSCPLTSRSGNPASSTNIPTSAMACSVMRSHCSQAYPMRRSSTSASQSPLA